MITNQDKLDAAEAAFLAKFDEVFLEGDVPGAWQLYTEIIKTSSKINEIVVLEAMPLIREWIAEKIFQALRASNATATIKKYEKSFEIERLDLAGDSLGVIGRRIDHFLGSDANSIYDQIAGAALMANPVGYDGVALFATTHPRGPGGNQSNLTTGGLSFAKHDAILTSGETLRDENGRSFRISYDTMIVGPSNRRRGQEITGSKERVIAINASGVEATASVVAAAAIPNVFAGGGMTLVVDPSFVGDHAAKVVYLDAKRGPKPVLMYQMRAPEPHTQFDMSDEGRFLFDKMRGSVECDVVAVAGAWQTAHLLTA